MAAVVKFFLSFLVTPLLIPIPEEQARDEDKESFVSVSRGPGMNSTALSECTRSAGRTTPDRTTATATETTNPYFAAKGHHHDRREARKKTEAGKYVEEPFVMRLRKISIAMLFGAVAICSCISIAMLIFTHTAASERGAGVHFVSIGFIAFNSVWTATYLRVAWTKQSTDAVVHFMLIGTIVVDVLVNLGSINYIPRPTEMSLMITFALLLQAPHMPRYFIAIIALSCWCAYNDFALSAGWTTLTLPNPYTYDDFTIVDSAIRISGAIVMMLFVMFLLYLQSEDNKRHIRTAESAVKVAAAVAERLGAYDTVGAKMALRTGKAENGKRHLPDEDDVTEGRLSRQCAGSCPTGDLSSQIGGRHGHASSKEPPSRHASASEEDEAIELDPKLLDAFQRLLVNLNAYRPYLPNWLLQSDTASEEVEEGESGTNPQGRGRSNSVTAVDSASGDSSRASSARGDRGAHAVHAQAQAQAQKANNKSAPVSHATFAAIHFWLDPNIPASQAESDLATAQFIELVLKEANAAKAAVHYSALGEILLSWNVCRSDPAPEAKAARFLSEVQGCLSAAIAPAETQHQSAMSSVASASQNTPTRRRPQSAEATPEEKVLTNLRRQSTALHLVRVAGAAVTGTIRTGEFGVKQRLRVDYAPGLRARLACLSKLARQLLLSNASSQNAAFEFSPAPMLSLLDSALSTQAENSFHIAHAGCAVVQVPNNQRPTSLLNSSETSTEQHQIFQLMGTRQSDDEWLYAMAEGAVDVWSDAWRKTYGPTLKKIKLATPSSHVPRPWLLDVDSLQGTPMCSNSLPGPATALPPSNWSAMAPAPIDGRGILRVFDQQSVNCTLSGGPVGYSSIDEPNASIPMSPQDPIAIAGLPEHCLVAIPDDAAAQIQGAVARVASMEGSAALRHSAATRALLDYVDRKLLVLYVVHST